MTFRPVYNPDIESFKQASASTIKVTMWNCSRCGIGYPMDQVGMFFDKDKHSPTGWNTSCKACRRDVAEKHRLAQISTRAKASKAMNVIVGEVMNSPRGRRTACVGMDEIAAALMDVFNGVDGYAQELKRNYDNAPDNTVLKAKYFKMVADAHAKANEIAKNNNNVEEMTNEELEEFIKEREERKRLDVIQKSALLQDKRILGSDFDEPDEDDDPRENPLPDDDGLDD